MVHETDDDFKIRVFIFIYFFLARHYPGGKEYTLQKRKVWTQVHKHKCLQQAYLSI